MIKKRLTELLSHSRKYIVYQVIWKWFALLAQMAAVISLAELLERAALQTIDWTIIRETVAVLLAAVVIRFICDRMAAKASYGASADVKRILREKIYEKLLRLGPSYREQISTAEVVQMSTEGVEQLEIYFGKYLPQMIYSLLAPLTLFFVLSFVNLKASIILLVCVPLIPLSIIAVQKIAKKLLSKYWGLYTGLGDSFLENLQGLTTLKVYQADEEKAEQMDREAEQFRKITMKVLTMQLNSTSVMDIVAYGGAAIGMIVAVSEFLYGNLGFAGALTIILLASEFFIPLRLLGSFFHIAMNGMAASDRIFRLLDMEEPEKGTESIPNGGNDICLRDVRFSYENDREILKGIDMVFPEKSFVSLAGESGCGKSTIAGLLMGKNREYKGDIKIGGTELSQINETELMRHITLIRHNSYLFKGTVKENLQMAKPDATEKEMEAVLEKVNLLPFLMEQEGLNTMLQEKGANFSGGQCQRLALARALLHDTQVYIFDEATSNIDAESEEMIMRVIHEMARTKTVILISHRLSNVIGSDYIYMMEDGYISEEGTHEELLKKNGKYRRLYESQKDLESYSHGKVVEA